MGKSDEIKKTDGRKYNKRLAPKPISSKDKLVPARTTKAKKDRIQSYSISAMKKQFGSEKEFFAWLAEKSKDSFNHLKLFMEYGYGKPSHTIDSDGKPTTKAPVINFNIKTDSPEKIIDITPKDE